MFCQNPSKPGQRQIAKLSVTFIRAVESEEVNTGKAPRGPSGLTRLFNKIISEKEPDKVLRRNE